MQEVCASNQTDVVLPLGVAYLDRILACQFVPCRDLQALASACLLLASKMRAPQPLTAKKLSDHTNGSIRMEEIMDWEILVLKHLQCNLLHSTPFEFFDQLLVRCPVLKALREDFARYCTAHKKFFVWPPNCLLFKPQPVFCLLLFEVKISKKCCPLVNRPFADILASICSYIDIVLDESANGVKAKRQKQQHNIQSSSSKRTSLGAVGHFVPTKAMHQNQTRSTTLWRSLPTVPQGEFQKNAPISPPIQLDGFILPASPPHQMPSNWMEDEASSISPNSFNESAVSLTAMPMNDSGFHSHPIVTISGFLAHCDDHI